LALLVLESGNRASRAGAFTEVTDMKRVEQLRDSFYSLSKSSTDGNRLYSILLDARVSAESENVHDTVEKLLSAEKENAKSALEHLWTLKKNLHSKDDTATLDMLIQFYQSKIDVLRNREEHIRKISKDSRELLEEKRKRDAEMASIKQQISEGTREITELSEKVQRLKTKEQELLLIETQVHKELRANENEVINGLYEIILPPERSEDDAPGVAAQETVPSPFDDKKDETTPLYLQEQTGRPEIEQGDSATIEIEMLGPAKTKNRNRGEWIRNRRRRARQRG
jgi:myosin heavy subunit